jgi:hypothetical protein
MLGTFFESGTDVAGGSDGPGTAGAFEFSDAAVRVGEAFDCAGDGLEFCDAEPWVTDGLWDAVESSPPQADRIPAAPVAIASVPASRRSAVRMGQP